MNYEEIEPYLIDFIRGDLEEEMEYRVKAYLKDHPDFQKELDELEETLHVMEEVPWQEPSPRMKMDFYAMLHEHQEAEAPPTGLAWQTWWSFFQSKLFLQRFALAGLLITIFSAGYWTSQYLEPKDAAQPTLSQQEAAEAQETIPLDTPQNQSLALDKEAPTKASEALKLDNTLDTPQDYPQELAFAETRSAPQDGILLDDMESEDQHTGEISGNYPTSPRAKADALSAVEPVLETDERIESIYASLETSQPEDLIITALIQTLNRDPNPNVRIAAIDALEKFANRQQVKYQIAQSLNQQKTPTVQLAAIDLIVKYRIKSGVTPLKKLLAQNQLNPTVREQAKIALRLIS